MTPTVVLAGALDTKGREFAFVKSMIEELGVATLTIDFGVMGPPVYAPDIERSQVAAAANTDMDYLADGDHKDEAMQAMAKGLTEIVRTLYEEGRLQGILGMGGTGGASIATAAMRSLPVGVPKVMVSTVGGSDVSEYTGARDIIFIPSIVDVAGINRISAAIYTNAAHAIAGMVRAAPPVLPDEKPIMAASMFGNTTPCVDRARAHLEKQGYEVLVFHATGTGGRVMESLIAEGFVAASLDITTTELADYVCGGVFSAGPERCLAAARMGIPTLLAPGCVDMANFGSMETMPTYYRSRNVYQWNQNITLLRTNAAENARMGEMLAEAANAATGPVSILLPLKGVSMLDTPGGPFWDPGADGACFSSIRDNVRPHVRIIELDYNINDPEFADACAETMLALIDEAKDRA
jgi:uncharacterized protein (UPF0261 family)